MTNLDSVLKSRDHFANKGPYNQSYGFSSSHVRMWELDHKENWAPKNGCFQIVVLEKTLKSPLDWKKIKLINPKGNQPWIFIGRTDAEASILWPPDTKSQLIGKDSDAVKDWRQKKAAAREDEMVGWHHWLNGHEFEQTPENGEGRGNLVCYSSWGRKESDTTEPLNHNSKESGSLLARWPLLLLTRNPFLLRKPVLWPKNPEVRRCFCNHISSTYGFTLIPVRSFRRLTPKAWEPNLFTFETSHGWKCLLLQFEDCKLEISNHCH